MHKHYNRGLNLPLVFTAISTLFAICAAPLSAQEALPPVPGQMAKPSIVQKVRSTSERLEMTVNTSRIITLDQKIPQAQVNNPDILDLVALSPTEVQLSAKMQGVTQVNLWGEDKKIYTIDVIVQADAEELKMHLRTQFPNASLKVVPLSNSVMISGYVDKPGDVQQIVAIAEQFYPKVLNNMTVSGVQQVLLHVKVMEVSRTKLRALGFDFAKITGSNIIYSGVSGLLSTALAPNNDATFTFDVFGSGSEFFGVLEALRQDNLMKILAEPTLVTVSGRPAFFNVGGEFPILVPQSLGTVSIEYKKFGTQVDFVPIVLGNGRVRLEVRPRVSEIDTTRSVDVGSTTVPGLKVREVDTGVEMKAGQTLALAGLVQTRVEAQNKGIPWVSEVPYLGLPFRRVREERNEIELLILVTPELVEAMDCHEVPPCGPGMRTTSPDDWDLYMRGHLEVPNCCPPGGAGCANCGVGDYQTQGYNVQPVILPETGLPLNTRDGVPVESVIEGPVIERQPLSGRVPSGYESARPPMPNAIRTQPNPPIANRIKASQFSPLSPRNDRGGATVVIEDRGQGGTVQRPPMPPMTDLRPSVQPQRNPTPRTSVQTNSTPRYPSQRYGRQIPPSPQPPAPSGGNEKSTIFSGFIGPVGYDDLD